MTVAEFCNIVRFKIREEDVKKVNGTIKDIKSTATKLLGAIGIGLSLTAVNGLVEEFGEANKQIRNAVSELKNMDAAQNGILEKANEARLAYTDMAGYVSNLTKAGADIFPIDDATQFVSTVAKLMKTNGRSDSMISSMMEGFNKSFQKGIVDSETLNKMLEQAPETANVLAKSLGVAKSQLLDMASSGTMTVQQLKAAFMDASGEIDAAFQNTSMTISDALKNIRNKWGLWLAQTDETYKITDTIARAMVKLSNAVMGAMTKARNAVVWFTDKLGGARNAVKLFGIAFGTVFGVRAVATLSQFVGGLKKIDAAALKLKLKAAAIMAVIVLIALLVEDFINFMQGNNSLLGAMLEKAGIDAAAVRDTIKAAWQKIKDFLTATWTFLKQTCGAIWGGIKDFFAKHGEQIRATLTAVWNTIKAVLLTIWSGIKTVATDVFGGLQRFFDKHGEQIKTAFTNIWTGIKNTLSAIWSQISGVFTAVWTVIKVAAVAVFSFLEKFWETWGSTILTTFTQIWNVIQSVFGAAFDVIADLFAAFSALFAGDWSGFWENIKQLAEDLWNGILNVISTILTAIWSVVSSVFSTIWDGIKTTVSGIKDSIVEGFTAAIDWIKSLPAQAFQWGADIISGIVDGIKSAVGKVGEAVSGVADKIKSFLGFSEPEDGPLSDFHTYMPDMIDLMAQGITGNRDKITGALQALCGDMSVVARAQIASPMTATIVAGGSSTSKSVYQTNNFNQQFNGERAIQKQAAAAMGKAAEDVTSQLARGLAYAR